MSFFNRAIKIMLWTNSTVLIAAAMFGPIYALFVKDIGGDLLDASFAYAIYALAAGLITLKSGAIADRIKENEMITVLGYVIIAAGYFGYLLVDSVLGLLIVQAIIGLGEAIYSPAWDAIYSKHLDGHRSGTSWGAWESINYFTLAFGAIAGGTLAAFFGFPAMFIAMGVLCLLSAVFIWRLPRKVL
jgi:predicted MFS family arabinose efflux permease